MFSMTAPVPPAEMLDALTQCAYRLGRAFAAEAERSHGKAMLETYERFSRCFFSVRMGIALKLRLGRPQPVRSVTETETEREAVEREPSDHLTRAEPLERERDRETERASMPLLLNALETVAADAASLPGPAPAALLTLRELLATFASAQTPALAPAVPPPRPTGDPRTRLAATTSTSVLTAPPRRHATGPPRR